MYIQQKIFNLYICMLCTPECWYPAPQNAGQPIVKKTQILKKMTAMGFHDLLPESRNSFAYLRTSLAQYALHLHSIGWFNMSFTDQSIERLCSCNYIYTHSRLVVYIVSVPYIYRDIIFQTFLLLRTLRKYRGPSDTYKYWYKSYKSLN